MEFKNNPLEKLIQTEEEEDKGRKYEKKEKTFKARQATEEDESGVEKIFDNIPETLSEELIGEEKQEFEESEEGEYDSILERPLKDEAIFSTNDRLVCFQDDGSLVFAERKMKETANKLEKKDMRRSRSAKSRGAFEIQNSKDEPKVILIKDRNKVVDTKDASPDKKLVEQAMRKRKIMRYSTYFTYIAVLALGLIAFFEYSMIRNTVYFENFSTNTVLKLAIDNCSLIILDQNEHNISSPIYVQYFMPSRDKFGPASVGSQILTEDSVTVNILNAGDSYYCLAKLFIKTDVTPIKSLEIACGKCNITQDTSSQLQVNGLLNLTGESLHANFRNVKVGSVSYQSFTGHLQFNNIESGPGVNNIMMSGEGDIVIQSIQDYVVNATTNTQAFCFGGTSLTSIDNGTCLYSDQDQTTPSNYKTCTLSWSVCNSEECNLTAFPTYVVNSTNGNIYANAIPQVGSPVIPKQTISGQIYNQGISFSSIAEKVLEAFDQYVTDPDKSNPFVILNVGDIASRSSKYTKWVVSSVPSYALVKPWWIATFSASMLDGHVEGANGILLPGFCPFYPDYINQNLLDIQSLIHDKIATPNTLVTFVVDEYMSAPTDYHQKYTGVFPLIEGGNPADKWFSLGVSAGGNIILENNDYTKKGEILAAIIVSLIIAGYATYLALTVTFFSINLIYIKLVNFSNLMSNYSKLEKFKETKKNEEASKYGRKNEFEQNNNKDEIKTIELPGLGSKYSFWNFFQNAPSPLAFIDYLSLLFFRQFSNSVVQFYALLFKEQTENDDQELDPSLNMMSGTEVKALYEKFCFVRHLNEQMLTDQVNQDVLRTYGFEIRVIDELKSQVFTRLNLKNKSPFLVNPKNIKNRNSLDLYIRENVKVTQFDEDQIEIAEFSLLYTEFCNYNRFPIIPISASLMENRYGINVSFVPQKFICRIPEEKKDSGWISDTQYLKNIFMWFSPPKKYAIDKSKLENHFKLVMDENQSMTSKQLDEATSDLILFPGWPLWDAFTVLLHLLLSALIIFPVIYFVVLNESQYQPWSLKDNQYLIRSNDFMHDPLQFIKNLYSSFTWNVALMVVATVLIIVTSFDLMLYYAIMEFPQDKSFKSSQMKIEKNFIDKRSRQIEWIFVLIALSFYFGYIALILVWLLLSAFINPTTFLPFTSAAVTFVVFVVSKFNTSKEILTQGTKMVTAYINKLFGNFTNKVMGKIAKNFKKSGKLPQKDTKGLYQPDKSKNFLIDTEIGSEVPDEELLFVEPESLSVVLKDDVASKNVGKRVLKLSELKLKKIRKVKEECAKRKFPPNFTYLMLSIFLHHREKQKQYVHSIIKDLNEKKGLSKHGADIITELIFPEGINKEEIILFNNIHILDQTLKKKKMEEIKGLNAEILYEMFMLFKDLDADHYDRFIQRFKERLRKLKDFPMDQVDFFLPILDIAAIIAKEKPDHWNIKHSCFKLFRIAGYLYSENEKAERKPEEIGSTLEQFVKFLPLMFSAYEVPYHVDDPKRLLDSQESLTIIENFCEAIGALSTSEETNQREQIIVNIIYLGISMINHEAGDIPKRVIRSIEEFFEARIPSKNFWHFCLNLINVLYNKPISFFQRLKTSAEAYGISAGLQTFLKTVTCCHMEGFEAHYLSDLTEKKNSYLIKISKAIKAKPKELLGLIELIHQKRNSKYAVNFFEAILTRMNLNSDFLEILQAIASIFFSHDEGILLQAIRTLKLDYPEFLLVGKDILNPKFIPASYFEEVGISEKSLIEEKKHIFDGPHEEFDSWKADIKKELIEKIPKYKKSYEDAKQSKLESIQSIMSPEDFKAHANLVSFYMTDWKTFTYSKKNIKAAILALNNPRNQLEKRLLNKELEKQYNGVDYLSRIAVISNLQLTDGKKFRKVDKEKESAINTLAEYLGLNPKPLGNFIKMFLVNDKDIVTKSFLSFFPEQAENETEIKKFLGFGFEQVAGMQKQLDFINNDFTNRIHFFENDTRIPPNLIKKIYFGTSYQNLGLNDIQDLISIKLNSSKLLPSDQEEISNQCLDLSFFAKGFVPNNPRSKIQISNQKVIDLIRIFSQTNADKKHSQITKIFSRQENDPEHPIKVAIIFSGLLAQRKFDVHSLIANQLKLNEPSIRKITQSIPSYLGGVFEIYPEFFELFYIIFERDVFKFFRKATPLLRRLSKAPILDTSLLESLFALSLGEKFNTHDLSQKAKVSSDKIEFFVSLARISASKTRKKELNTIRESKTASEILTQLKVDPDEFFSLLKLIFNEFEMTEEGVSEILFKLGLKPDDESGLVEVNFLKEMLLVTASTDPKLNIFKNKKVLKNFQSKTSTFWNALNMEDCKQEALIISRLAAGNFLVLEEFRDHLGWIFPTSDGKAERAILNLTMGLYGLIHSGVEITNDLNMEVETFVEKLYPKGDFYFKEPEYRVDSTILPNNSLAYAIYLTYHTLDIPPKWVQSFLFDKKAIDAIHEKTIYITKEFILALVLQVKGFNDVLGNLFGLYEWAEHCQKFYGEKNEKLPETILDDLRKKADPITEFFYDNIAFEYETIKGMAISYGLLAESYWKSLLKDNLTYNMKINETLFYLRTMNLNKEEKELASKVKVHFGLAPTYFLENLECILDKDLKNEKEKAKAVGNSIKEAIITAYETVYKKLYKPEQRYPGFALTNLCMIADLTFLRTNSTFIFQRKLHRLHQIFVNIERIMIFDDVFFKLSKFELIKLLGVALNMQISNVLEWCMAPSLFSNDYVKKLELTPEPERKKMIKKEECEKILYKKKRGQTGSVLNEKQGKTSIFLGDLGYNSGGYMSFAEKLGQILVAKSWDEINSIFEYDAIYFTPQQKENFKAFPGQETNQDNQALENRKPQGENVTPKSSELVKIVFGPQFYRSLSEARSPYLGLESKKPEGKNEEVAKHLIDVGPVEKSVQFEKTLMSLEMNFILGVIRGDPADFLERENVLNDRHPTKEPIKLYLALLGLRSYMKREKKNKLGLSSYLNNLSNCIESDVTILDELLNFLVNRKSSFLNHVTNLLDMRNDVLNLLLFNLDAGAKNEEDDTEEESKLSLIKTISNVLETVPKDHLEALEVIRQLYLLKDPKAWTYVIQKLRKDEKKLGVEQIMHLRKIFSKVDFTSWRIWEENKSKVQLMPEESRHPLEKFIALINFRKLRKQALAGEDKQLLKSLNISSADFGDIMCQILEKSILPLSSYAKYRKEDNSVKKNYYLINLLLQEDFAGAFEHMVLDETEGSQEVQRWSKVANLLKEFEVETNQKDIKFFVLYVTFAQNRLGSFKKHKKYQEVVESIIRDLVEEKLLSTDDETSKGKLIFDNDFQNKLSQLIIGALAWDFDLCIKSLASADTLDEGYLLFCLYGCLNMENNLEKSPLFYLRALLPLIYPSLLSRPDSLSTTDTLKKNYLKVMKEHLGENDVKALETKSDEFFKKMLELDPKKKPMNLSKRMCETMKKGYEGTFIKKNQYETFEEIFCSFCDGTILAKLINTFVYQEKAKKPIQKALKAIFHFLLEFQSFSGIKTQADHLHEAFKGLIEAINELNHKDVWDKVLKLSPKILDILLKFQVEGRPNLDKQKDELLRQIVNFIEEFKKIEENDLLVDTMTVMLKTDVRKLAKGEKIKYEMELKQRFDIFFERVCESVFPGICTETGFDENARQEIYQVLNLLNKDYLEKIKDRQTRHEIVKALLKVFEKLEICSKEHLEILLNMLNEDLKDSNKIILALANTNDITEDRARMISEYFQQVLKYFKTGTFQQKKPTVKKEIAVQNSKKKIIDIEEWDQMMKKIKEGTTTSRDLFRMVDQEGDRSGSINEAEFLILAGRLGLKLSDHRVKEIFAKVKGNKVQDKNSSELNEEEFEKALTYLEQKNLEQALELLQITPEILMATLVKLVILLLLIFVFLFLGLKAFAIGGTFGSIVNSIFPIAGGIAVGKNKQGEENLNEDTVKDATDKGFEIATSREL